LTIQSIDKDHNGYVTQTELDDILRIVIPELKDKILKPIYLPFVSSANKVLVDYKRFKAFIIGNSMGSQSQQQIYSNKNRTL